jgi:hypothetical protein
MGVSSLNDRFFSRAGIGLCGLGSLMVTWMFEFVLGCFCKGDRVGWMSAYPNLSCNFLVSLSSVMFYKKKKKEKERKKERERERMGYFSW